MAIFWRTAELELLDKGTFWLSETPDQVSKGWDASYRRTCTWAGFRHKKSGQTCYFSIRTSTTTARSPARSRSNCSFHG